MKLHMENPKDSIHKKTCRINAFGIALGYKITIQKSIVFLYANLMQFP